MNAHMYPTVITRGQTIGKPKLSLTSRVNANTQKKIDKINRTNEAQLQSTYHMVDMAQVFTSLDFKKERIMVKKKMATYQNQIEGYKRLQQNRGSKSLLNRQTPEYVTHMKILPPVIRERQETMAQIYDVEAIRSIRRKRKPILDNSSVRCYSDLYRLQDKHIAEYQESMDQMQKLELKTGITFSLRVPRRSLSAYKMNVEDPAYISLISKMRNQIKYTENSVHKIQKKFKEMSRTLYRDKSSLGKEEADNVIDDANDKLKEKTFHIFCDNETRQDFSGQEKNNSRPGSLSVPQSRLPTRRSVRFTPDNKPNTPYLNVAKGPFDDDSRLPQTRSRKLLETPKEETMHIWLGFNNREDMERALKHRQGSKTSGSSKKPSISLTEILEQPDAIEERTTPALIKVTTPFPVEEVLIHEDSTPSEVSAEEDIDPRFNVFNAKKVMGKPQKGN